MKFDMPKLTSIQPSIESSVLKLVEEVGEVAECAGKFRGINGEKFALPQHEVNQENLKKELIDVIQAATTVLYVIGVDQAQVDAYLRTIHIPKMKQRGYL